MFKSSFLKAGAIGALVTAMLAAAMPVQAQDRGGREGRGLRAERAERTERPQRVDRGERREARRTERQARAAAPAQVQAPVQAAPQMQRRGNYGAEGRDRSYGAYARSGDQGVERQTREVQARIAAGASPERRERREWRQEQRTERREDARETRRDYGQGYRAGQSADRRDDRRDQRQAYNQGYRAGDRSDDRLDRRWGYDNRGNHNRRWDNRGWRNDNRYDWYRYRAANRAIYRPGRYYSPYRGYSYSRVNIGFRLGNLFYSNRYWINDPWQYRLPSAYGPYRWVRYYDDALLVDTYSGQVVDVIHDFFW